jgi:creatinine amidohydrolase
MRYGDCQWPQIAACDKEKQVVVCPIAALEQHGHHLPLLTDTYLVTEVAQRVEKLVGDKMLLTPTLWLGASDHHIRFPGTISLPNTLYIEVLKNMVRSFVKAGFRRIFFLNGHGGNVSPGDVAITEMANSCPEADNCNVALGSYWTIAAASITPEKHGMHSPLLTHACEYETSMVLRVAPQTVNMSLAKGAGDKNVFPPGGVKLAGSFGRRTATGALGHPEFATAEKGESLFTAIAQDVAAYIDNFSTWPLREVIGPARP